MATFREAVLEAQTYVADGRGDPFGLVDNLVEVNSFYASNDFRLIEENLDIVGEPTDW